MIHNDLISLKKWFFNHCKSFYSLNKEYQKNILLKENHTRNVCSNTVQIAEEHSFSRNDVMIAETAALFHDVGRFSQYAKYKTFKDNISVNHGKLGAEILTEKQILKNLPENEQEIIINAVRFHNAFKLPSLKNQGDILFLKLIRDADKLDIWRIFVEHYEGNKNERASATTLNLPDTPEYSEEIISCIFKKQAASYTHLKTLNDFKLLQLSWIFDLHFKTSFRLILERDYIKRIAYKLPQNSKISSVFILLREFASQRLK